MASLVRVLPGPPSAGPACLRAIERAVFRESVASVPAALQSRFPACPQPAVAAAAATSPARAPRRIARRGPLLHPAFPRVPCRSMFPPGPGPWTPRRAPRSRLPCISTLPPLQTGNPPAVPAYAQFRSCRRPWVQSSEYFLEGCPPRFLAEAFAGVLDFAAPRPRRVSRLFARRCICPVPPRFHVESYRPEQAAIARLPAALRRSRRETELLLFQTLSPFTFDSLPSPRDAIPAWRS